MLLFLKEFDKAWKSKDMNVIFPSIARNRIKKLEKSVKQLTKRSEIRQTFSHWKSIGVWNVSDFLTFIFTSRISMYIADCIENRDLEGIKQANKYLLYFINYLLLTNIHPPSESHRDHQAFFPQNVPHPRTYEDAQEKMRKVLASKFADKIWKSKKLKEKFEKIFGHTWASPQNLMAEIKEEMLPKKTPPLLIKNIGLAKELFVFHKLISQNIGFVIPTLLYQRIFKALYEAPSKKSNQLFVVKVPDFLVIKGGRVMGIELGRERQFFGTRKAELITTFSSACGIPTAQVNVEIGNPIIGDRYDFGFKCNRCYRSFILCDKFIDAEVEANSKPFDERNAETLTCDQICGEKEMRKCLDATAVGKILNYETSRANKKLIHFRCSFESERSNIEKVIPLFPMISGLEFIKEGLS